MTGWYSVGPVKPSIQALCLPVSLPFLEPTKATLKRISPRCQIWKFVQHVGTMDGGLDTMDGPYTAKPSIMGRYTSQSIRAPCPHCVPLSYVLII